MTTIAVQQQRALVLADGQDMFTDKQRAALAVMGIKDATNAELAVFLHVCQRTRLDPFTRQIYYIKYGGKWTIQVGIDGFRVLRDRVAKEQDCTVEFEDTVWYDADNNESAVWTSADPPAACRVVLLKHAAGGRTLRFPAVLRTAAYAAVNSQGQLTGRWAVDGSHQIEKCCEAFSTRRAFPHDFSGVYLAEEMAGRVIAEAAPPAPVRRVTAGQVLGREPLPDEPQTGSENEKPVTAQMVNDQFKRLGFTVKDKPEVLAAASALAGLDVPVKAVGDLSRDGLAEVHGRLAQCADRDALLELLVLVAESRGPADGEQPDGDGDA